MEHTTLSIVVVGDAGVGKSNLISSYLTGQFSGEAIIPQLPETHVGPSMANFQTTQHIFDTSSTIEDEAGFRTKLREANVIVLCFSSDVKDSYERLLSFWFPRLKNLNIKAQISIVETKKDISTTVDFASLIAPVASFFNKEGMQVTVTQQVSAMYKEHLDVLFRKIIQSALWPLSNLLRDGKPTEPFLAAMLRIFKIMDEDGDNLLSRHELASFFTRTNPEEGLKEEEAEGLVRETERMMREEGREGELMPMEFKDFVLFHLLVASRIQRPAAVWNVLHSFGYQHDLSIAHHFLSPPFPRYDAQKRVIELNAEAEAFLMKWFRREAKGSSEVSRSFLDLLQTLDPLLSSSSFLSSSSDSISAEDWANFWRAETRRKPEEVFRHLRYFGWEKDPAQTFKTEQRIVSGSFLTWIASFLIEPKTNRNTMRVLLLGSPPDDAHNLGLRPKQEQQAETTLDDSRTLVKTTSRGSLVVVESSTLPPAEDLPGYDAIVHAVPVSTDQLARLVSFRGLFPSVPLVLFGEASTLDVFAAKKLGVVNPLPLRRLDEDQRNIIIWRRANYPALNDRHYNLKNWVILVSGVSIGGGLALYFFHAAGH